MAEMEIIGLGAMNMDHIYQVEKAMVDGEQVVTESASIPGGSAANTIYGLAKLGVKTGFVGAVGTDKDGKRLISDLKTVNVDTSQIRIKKANTGCTICISDKLGRRAIYVVPGANSLLSIEDVDLAYLNRARIVHLSSFANDTQLDLQVRLIENLVAPIKISLAPGMIYASKGLKGITPLLKKAHVVFVNRKEIEQLTGKEFRSGAQECIKLGCHTIVVTFGKGLVNKKRTIIAYICQTDKNYEIELEADNSRFTLETTGAGDAFAAGFLFGLLRGKTIEECGLLGHIMGRFAISHIGARKGLPTLAQLSHRYFEYSGQQL